MRILEESEINYNIDDIVEAVESDTGFSMVSSGGSEYYVMLGSKIRLEVDFDYDGEVKVELIFPETSVDMSESYTQVEMYSTAIESATQVVDIIRKMTGEGRNEEDNI